MTSILRIVGLAALLSACQPNQTHCGTKCFVPAIRANPGDLSTGVADNNGEVSIVITLGADVNDATVASVRSQVFVTSPNGSPVPFDFVTPTLEQQSTITNQSAFVVHFTASDPGWYSVGLEHAPQNFLTTAPTVAVGERWSLRVNPAPVLTPGYLYFATDASLSITFSQPLAEVAADLITVSADGRSCVVDSGTLVQWTSDVTFHCGSHIPTSVHVTIREGLTSAGPNSEPLTLVNGSSTMDQTVAMGGAYVVPLQ